MGKILLDSFASQVHFRAMTDSCRWILGLAVAMFLGGIVSWAFLEALRGYMRLKKAQDHTETTRPVPAWLTGCMERGFFCLIVAFNVSGAATAMMAWITLKMVTNWNSPGIPRDTKQIRFAFSALLAGLVSMSFAVLGGIICRGQLSS